MILLQIPPTDDPRYLAFKARDARFDGCFFTGVTSTGIYCRPVCRVRTPKRENCRFFAYAAQAEQAGFRPCLRCRPELAPRAPALAHSPELRVWSMQDASSILALQAARLLDSPGSCDSGVPALHQLALRLGVTDRHLRRIFNAQFGVSPLRYLQTQRLLRAKQLLTDTTLAVTQVATLSGFGSVRRFNAAFVQAYGLNPTKLRLKGVTPLVPGHSNIHNSIHVRLAYRPPYDALAMLQFFATHQLNGLEVVSLAPQHLYLRKTVAVQQGDARTTGWLEARFDVERYQLDLRLSDSLRAVVPRVMEDVRAMFDLDADPQAINDLLHADFPWGDGLRVPGNLDGFELAVRAVLGQQITVAAACTLATRLVAQFGEPLDTPIAGLNRLFPTPAALAGASSDALGQLGIVRQRQAAIWGLANMVLGGQLHLHAGADVPATLACLLALPGIGDWTAQYIAMRALRWPDAFVAGDVAVQKALGVRHAKHPIKEAQATSLAWRPWRSYAVIRAWAVASTALIRTRQEAI